jgi:hypothetical protein
MPESTYRDPLTGDQIILEMEAAPGADLVDPECLHGNSYDYLSELDAFQNEWHPLIQDFEMIISSIGMTATVPVMTQAALRYGQQPERMALLLREQPSDVVESSCKDQDGADYGRT